RFTIYDWAWRQPGRGKIVCVLNSMFSVRCWMFDVFHHLQPSAFSLQPFPTMTAPNHRWRKFKNALMQAVTFICAILVVAPLVLVFYHLVKEGFSSINLAFFTRLPAPVGETGGGLANAIVGTFILLGQAAVLGVPIGVLGGVFLSEYGSSRLN